jgi:hypothetical protein
MSITRSPASATVSPPESRPALPRPASPAAPCRVRHLVRDGVAVIVFSAAASTALAGAMMLLITLAGQGA